jgi:hypothetical protein
VETALGIVAIKDAEEIKPLSRNLGLAPLRAVYRWAETLMKAETGLDVNWQLPEHEPLVKLAQLPDLRRLVGILGECSETEDWEQNVVGVLEAFDNKKARFTIETDDGLLLSGKVVENLLDKEWTVHKIHEAVIKSSKVLKYSSEEETTTHLLVRLVPLGK